MVLKTQGSVSIVQILCSNLCLLRLQVSLEPRKQTNGFILNLGNIQLQRDENTVVTCVKLAEM